MIEKMRSSASKISCQGIDLETNLIKNMVIIICFTIILIGFSHHFTNNDCEMLLYYLFATTMYFYGVILLKYRSNLTLDLVITSGFITFNMLYLIDQINMFMAILLFKTVLICSLIYDALSAKPKHPKGCVGMWAQQIRARGRGRLNNAGANRRGGPVGNFPPGDPRHVDPAMALAIANRLGDYGPGNFVAQLPEEHLDDLPEWTHQWKKIVCEFIHSDFPKVKCLFHLEELDSYGIDSMLMNPLGTPFCGITAIDLAVGILPKPDVYLKRAKYMDSPYKLGTSTNLAKHAFNRGVNLRIIIPYGNEIPTETYDYCNDQSWRWVILVVKDNNGNKLMAVPDQNSINHAFLVLDEKSNYEQNDIVTINFEPSINDLWFLIFELAGSFFATSFFSYFLIYACSETSGFFSFYYSLAMFFAGNNDVKIPTETVEMVTYIVGVISTILPILDELIFLYLNFSKIFLFRKEYKFIEYRYNPSNHDRRNIRERRDLIESQDCYAVLVLRPVFRLFGFNFVELDNPYICMVFGFEPKEEVIISVNRTNQIFKEIQLCNSSELSVALVSMLKANYLNTDDSLPLLYKHTSDYLKYCHNNMKLCESRKLRTVAYAAQGALSYIADLNIVGINQFAVCVGSGFAKEAGGPNLISVEKESINNGFLSCYFDKIVDKTRKAISFAPLFSIYTWCTQVGPGHVCTTTPTTLFAAMVGRSMVKIPHECFEFLRFSYTVIDWLISNLDSSGVIIDEDCVQSYRRINRGKRTQKYIESKINAYNDCLVSKKKHGKFFNNSCFVKLEDSSKVVNGVSRVRPRLIMTMSDYLSIRLSPLIELIDTWNKSLIERYQVKSLDPETFVNRVVGLTSHKHIVTDYSAFESSVSYCFKKAENYMIKRLYDKYQFHEVYKDFKSLSEESRVLHSSIGKFRISSRCSGDYLTSTFNCLINFLINAYSAHKLGLDFRLIDLIVEGDDGLTKPEQIDNKVIKSLGFGFSDNTAGSSVGDVDFLRRRWVHEGSLINVGRALKNLFWVNTNQRLTIAQQKSILRAKAMSYYFLSPGHPIITPAINYILRKTSGCNYFRGLEQYLSYNVINSQFDVKKIGKNMGTIPVREELRHYLAEGAVGFPQIPITCQLEIERSFNNDVLYVSSILDEYDDIKTSVINNTWFHDELGPMSTEMLDCLRILQSDLNEFEQLLQSYPNPLQRRVDYNINKFKRLNKS